MQPHLSGLVAGLAVAAGPAAAQSTGGLSGLMGGMLPSVASSSAGNAAGVLSYCVKNKILGGAGATSALSGLLGQKGVKSSDDYTAGQNGDLLTGNGSAFSLKSIKGKAKTKVCNLVLKHASSLL